MPAARSDARWTDAVPLTLGLWLFVLVIFLPAIIVRHTGEDWSNIALDSATVILSIGFALGLFALFRVTLDWSLPLRLIVLSAAVTGVSLAQTLIDLSLTEWIAHNLRSAWLSVPVGLGRASASLLNYICVFTVNVALFQLIFSRRRSLTRERQLAAARSTAQQAQLQALRLQLNPHFLFNTLNAISSLIITRRNDDAEQMTDKLSSFLRASLACDPARLVLVEHELDLTGDYLDIEAVRFGDRLRVEISCDPAARNLCVPGMLIQPLVENAIKYGVARSATPVTIAIGAALEQGVLCLTVSNDDRGGELPAKTSGAGVGLNNVRQRLAALYGDRASLTAGPAHNGYLARICVPLRQDGTPDARI